MMVLGPEGKTKKKKEKGEDTACKREASVKHDSCLHTSEGLSV